LEKDLEEWIEKVIQPREEIGGIAICPFAKKGKENRKIFSTNIDQDPEAFMINYIQLTSDFDLIVFYNHDCILTNDDLLRIIDNLQSFLPDMILLKDHPEKPGYINGVYTGNGKYPTILVQPRDKLNDAREKLKKTKYYDYWSEEYLKEIWSYGSESKSD